MDVRVSILPPLRRRRPRPCYTHSQEAAPAAPLAEVQRIFAAYTPTLSEAQLEDDLVKPVLRAGYAEQAAPVRERKAEALTLERRIAALVNQAYGLTPEEIDLLCRSAPPRMPVGRAKEE